MLENMKRKEWVANPADPTQVIQWKGRWGKRPGQSPRVELTLTGSWGVESRLSIYRWSHRTYDNWFFKWLFGYLEDRWGREQEAYANDPMGRLSDYE